MCALRVGPVNGALSIVFQGIQDAIRSSLAHIRQSRIAPSTINAPPPGFVPPALGVGLPQNATASTRLEDASKPESHAKTRGLQEERVERDAWRGVLDALERIRSARDPGNDDDVAMLG